MFKINKLRVEILTYKSETIDDLYGFEFSFNQGLNIIAGENSRGKTTINSCIFYALGMEELLGGYNNKALDKALKDTFVIKTDVIGEEKEGEETGVNYKVKNSKVFLEIENEKNEIVCLERAIIASKKNDKQSNITIYKSKLDNIDEDTVKGVFFVNGRGNNDDPNGFYEWFKDFINLTVPEVSNSNAKSDYSPLYLQMIFSSIFIEQTKGWSDFFATMPYFGVTKPKEKVIEFLLNLDEINISTKRDTYNKEKNSIVDNWNKTIKAFSYLEKQNNAIITSLPETITSEKKEIQRISSNFLIGEDEIIGYNEYLKNTKDLIFILENKPLATIESKKEEVLIKYEVAKTQYIDLNRYIEEFDSKLDIEKLQIKNINFQLIDIKKEIKEHTNLIKVFNNNLFDNKKESKCPTCTQIITEDIISNNDITIPQLSLEENKSFLNSQKLIIDSTLTSLTNTIEEKNSLLLYFKNTLRNKEILLKSLSKDLIADDRALSESEVVQKIQLQQEVENLNQFDLQLNELKEELISLSNKHHNILIKLDGLEQSDDGEKLKNFERNYKDLLFSFGYDSNFKNQVSINRKEPFKYFSVYKRSADDKQPQSIRINSSASDFVRNIWAYTLALRNNGKNHPGLILFDEPGQHRTKLSSLKALFEKVSKEKNKQTIIFTSIDKPLNNDEKEKLDLDEIIKDLEKDSYHLIKLGKHKVIKSLN
ncbi:AAA family ATPase [Polaribacter sp. Z014]|uniref:AAA family ATPase n=1 Tax=Polaribacter sp. Z014 TaxID=2927126 RepID=UPI0020224B1E|nr:AAA family ATPase [Polaribacter sp. Z014]MCL7762827.1 AAA family ATPase [Polaribacter sp. Z014]